MADLGEYIFANAVLKEFEQRPEYDINPERGSVSYETRWSVGYVRRRGRNHLELELRKLYEGAPYEVIKHFHSFAVVSAVAADDRNANGDRNIGVRAKELVNAYLEFTRALVTVSEHLGLVASQEDIGQFDSEKVKYRGWWTHPEFKSLGHVALETMPFADLRDRSKDIFNLLQRLQKSHSLSAWMSQEMIETLKVFGIDHQQHVSGWGGALDKIFDTVIASLTAMKQLLLDSLPETL